MLEGHTLESEPSNILNRPQSIVLQFESRSGKLAPFRTGLYDSVNTIGLHGN